MKNILLFSILVFTLLIASACETGFGSSNDTIPVSSIRSAASDPVVNCAIEEVHQHDGIHYAGHYNNDGHGHHGLEADNICTINSCTETGLHRHNGIYYAGHHGSDGHGGHGNGHHE